jgi:hypothetical protein
VRDEPQRSVGVPQLLGGVLRLGVLALIGATPVLGVWVSSSLAAYQNGSAAFAFVVGALLFPVAPLLWELWTSGRPRKSRFLDRLVLRTLALNLLFLIGLIGSRPQLAFVALSTRGDWFLDGEHGPRADRIREVAFGLAARLEWLYLAVHHNPYREVARKDDPKRSPPPRPDENRPTHAQAVGAPHWPMPLAPHPVIAAIPPSAEESIGSVGYYIAEHERDPVQRVKALHDYVVSRIAYDVPALSEPSIPVEDGDPEWVFRNRKGVCAGYARLLAALGRVTGDEIVYVVGNVRSGDGEDPGGVPHAWNTARIGNRWYMIDATWDAGDVGNQKFTRHYGTTYLFTTPEIFSIDHIPDDERWQLRAQPLSRGDFMRQPLLRPQFFIDGLELLAPDRSQVTVDSVFEARVRSRNGKRMLAHYLPRLGGAATDCAVEGSGTFTIRCALASAVPYQVVLFSGPGEGGHYWSVGSIDVNRR